MSGHSKWSTIKHQKGAADAKRGVIFTKISRDITLAVREGGGDPDMNFRLRLMLDKAKSNNMPQDSISRAVKRGTGEGGDGDEKLEEIVYEGYGPGGGAILIQAVTTNRNRTAADVRSTFARGGGNLGESGCVAWNFEYPLHRLGALPGFQLKNLVSWPSMPGQTTSASKTVCWRY